MAPRIPGNAKPADRAHVAKSLGISKGVAFQAIRTARLDARIKQAMVVKSRTGWRARQQDVRRYARQSVDEVLRELGASNVLAHE